MKLSGQAIAAMLGFFCLWSAAQAQVLNPASAPVIDSGKPETPVSSPVDFFRKLLALKPVERENCLTNRPPAARERILAKVMEYELLPPDERDARLLATELRWWLAPMLGMSPSNRIDRLAQAPENLRPIIQARLDEWSILPPPLQEQLLPNDKALNYFSRAGETELRAFDSEQKKVSEVFRHFFTLNPEERRLVLHQLSDEERENMEQALESFEKLPKAQRELCVNSFAKFAQMNNKERAEFLKSAEQWSQMTPEDRQAWRDLVAQVPLWPSGFIPQMPAPTPAVGVATN